MVHKFITAKLGNGSKNDESLGCGHKPNNQSAGKKAVNNNFCYKFHADINLQSKLPII